MSPNGLHRIRWRRVAVTRFHRFLGESVCERIRKFTSSGVVAEVENVGKRTPSDPMKTGCRDKTPSDAPRDSSRETW